MRTLYVLTALGGLATVRAMSKPLRNKHRVNFRCDPELLDDVQKHIAQSRYRRTLTQAIEDALRLLLRHESKKVAAR